MFQVFVLFGANCDALCLQRFAIDVTLNPDQEARCEAEMRASVLDVPSQMQTELQQELDCFVRKYEQLESEV